MKYAWQHDDIIVFRQRHTKRLVEYKWSDIEKGIYNNGKYLLPQSLDKVADMFWNHYKLPVVLFESGKYYLPERNHSKALFGNLPKNDELTWHTATGIRGKRYRTSVIFKDQIEVTFWRGIFFGLDKNEDKWMNTIVMVNNKCKQIATATIEMESNNGTIIL